jgi:hypothetical protein
MYSAAGADWDGDNNELGAASSEPELVLAVQLPPRMSKRLFRMTRGWRLWIATAGGEPVNRVPLKLFDRCL